LHAGDISTMACVIRLCARHNVSIGAHPSYPDRANFGRTEMNLSSNKIEECIRSQVKTLVSVAEKLHCSVRHVKPHGALYNVATKDARVSAAIAAGVKIVDKRLILLGLAGSPMLDVWRGAGFTVAAEAFADRRYEPDGLLRSRKLPGAVINDPSESASTVTLRTPSRSPVHCDKYYRERESKYGRSSPWLCSRIAQVGLPPQKLSPPLQQTTSCSKPTQATRPRQRIV